MSYDLWFEIGPFHHFGEHEPVCIGRDFNYTYNIAPMMRDAIGQSINDWDGLPATLVSGNARAAIATLTNNAARYEAMNPPNGWGNRSGLVKFLAGIVAECDAYPTAVVRVA